MLAWFNRDRTPVRFTVTTSVASGLIVAGVVHVVRNSSPGLITLWWLALGAAGGAVLFGGAWALYRAASMAKRVFLMTSAFSQKYYLADLVQRVHDALDRNGADMVLKVPNQDYDASGQSHHLFRLSKHRREYAGGIILATEPHRIRGELSDFCQNSRLPVVFTDIEPFDEPSEYPKNSVFVGYDSGMLGELAGRWLVRHLQNTPDPHVLIIASREHPARQRRCEQVLTLGLPTVSVTVDEEGDFMRSRACRAVSDHIAEFGPGQRLDAVFCTNDEMALGAVDALSPASPPTRTTVVVGIDGVLEARTLIDAGTSPLRATVVQDTHRLANRIVDVLEKLHRGSAVPTRTVLDARIYEAARK